jgi:protein SCO1/2
MYLGLNLKHLVLTFFLATLLIGCLEENKKVPVQVSAFDSLPLIRKIPVFEGQDDGGTLFTDKEMKGHYWLTSFFFSTCQDICPRLNSVVNKLTTITKSDKIKFLSITVDPEHDTPPVLLAHRNEQGFLDKRWKFLNIYRDSLLHLTTGGFLVGSVDNPANHSARIILIDTAMNIRGYFDAFDSVKVQQLTRILSEIK